MKRADPVVGCKAKSAVGRARPPCPQEGASALCTNRQDSLQGDGEDCG